MRSGWDLFFTYAAQLERRKPGFSFFAWGCFRYFSFGTALAPQHGQLGAKIFGFSKYSDLQKSQISPYLLPSRLTAPQRVVLSRRM
jgi:hypothetical protein